MNGRKRFCTHGRTQNTDSSTPTARGDEGSHHSFILSLDTHHSAHPARHQGRTRDDQQLGASAVRGSREGREKVTYALLARKAATAVG